VNQAVDVSELSDTEVESFAQAVDMFRAAPTSPQRFTPVPVRDEKGKLCEVRFYKDNSQQAPLGVIRIADDGALTPTGWL
jgi:hypothetical protein